MKIYIDAGTTWTKILKIEKHPETDHLHVMQVDVGDEKVQIFVYKQNT